MRKKINPLYFMIPILHFIVIGLLLFLQFKPSDLGSTAIVKSTNTVSINEKVIDKSTVKSTEKGRSSKRSKFRKKIGSLLVYSNKKSEISGSSVDVSSAIVETGNFSFLFEDKKDVLFVPLEGRGKKLSLKEIKFDKESIEMVMSDSVVLTFRNLADKSVELVASTPKAGSVSISLAPSEKSKLSIDIDFKSLLSEKKRDQFVLFQSAQATVKNPLVTLYTTSNKSSVAKIISVSTKQPLWESVLESFEDKLSFSDALNIYQNRAFYGWESGRFSQSTGMWEMANRQQGISAELVSSFLTQSYLNDEPSLAITAVTHSNLFNYTLTDGSKYDDLYINPEVESFETALFYGKMKENYDNSFVKAKVLITQFRKSVRENDFSLFENVYLVDYISFWGTEDDEHSLISFMKEALKENSSIKLSSSILLSALRVIDLYPNESNSILELSYKSVSKLFSEITYTKEGYFVSYQDKISSIETIKAAYAFDSFARKSDNLKWKGISSNLINSLVVFVDKNGFMPEFIKLSDFTAFNQSRIAPESVLIWSPDKSCAPRLELLRTKSAGVVKVYHRAKSLKLIQEEKSFSLKFNHWFNVGSQNKATGILNAFFIKSLPKYERVSMWGADSWPGDPGFGNWRVGFYYWENDEMAAVMLRHRSSNESISFYYE